MKKNIKIILTILTFILLPTFIYADCTEEELNHFKEIEDEYKVTYEFDTETKSYTVTAISPERKKYLLLLNYITISPEEETNMNVTYEDNDETLIIKYNGIPARTHEFKITGNTPTCDSIIKSIEITLPKYNPYSEDKLCEDIKEFVLCQPTYDKELDYDTFVSRVNTYKKTKSNEDNNKIEEKEENQIVTYIEDNYLKIIIIAIFAVVVTITIILSARTIRKRRRLE